MARLLFYWTNHQAEESTEEEVQDTKENGLMTENLKYLGPQNNQNTSHPIREITIIFAAAMLSIDDWDLLKSCKL